MNLEQILLFIVSFLLSVYAMAGYRTIKAKLNEAQYRFFLYSKEDNECLYVGSNNVGMFIFDSVVVSDSPRLVDMMFLRGEVCVMKLSIPKKKQGYIDEVLSVIDDVCVIRK